MFLRGVVLRVQIWTNTKPTSWHIEADKDWFLGFVGYRALCNIEQGCLTVCRTFFILKASITHVWNSLLAPFIKLFQYLDCVLTSRKVKCHCSWMDYSSALAFMVGWTRNNTSLLIWSSVLVVNMWTRLLGIVRTPSWRKWTQWILHSSLNLIPETWRGRNNLNVDFVFEKENRIIQGHNRSLVRRTLWFWIIYDKVLCYWSPLR